MITDNELLEFQRKLKEAKTDSIDTITETFYSKVTQNVKTILESNTMVYDNRTFDKLNKIMKDMALDCLEKWNVKEHSSFNKFFEQFAFLSNQGLPFLRNVIIDGQTAIDEFKANLKPIGKNMQVKQSEEDAIWLEEWKSNTLNRFKEWNDSKTGLKNYFKANISLKTSKLRKLQKMINARDEAVYTFFNGIKPTIKNIINCSILRRGIVPKDEIEHKNWIDAASAHSVEILKKWDPAKGAIFKTYLLSSKGQILDVITNTIWTGKRQDAKNNKQAYQRDEFAKKGAVKVLSPNNGDIIKYTGDTHLSIDAIHSDSENDWALRDAIIDPKNITPEKELESLELHKELEQTESLDKKLSSELSKRLTESFINLGSDIQTIIIDCCINKTSDSKMGQKIGKYRKTVTSWKKKGLNTLKNDIEDFFIHKNLINVQPKRRKRILAKALEHFLGKE